MRFELTLALISVSLMAWVPFEEVVLRGSEVRGSWL